jgi:hypothetical protein
MSLHYQKELVPEEFRDDFLNAWVVTRSLLSIPEARTRYIKHTFSNRKET